MTGDDEMYDCIRDEQNYESGSVVKVKECILRGHHLIVDGERSLIIGNNNTLNGVELTAIGDHGTINGVNCHVYGNVWDLNGFGGQVEWGNAKSLKGVSNMVVDGTCMSITGISNSCSKGIDHVDDGNEMNCGQRHTEWDTHPMETHPSFRNIIINHTTIWVNLRPSCVLQKYLQHKQNHIMKKIYYIWFIKKYSYLDHTSNIQNGGKPPYPPSLIVTQHRQGRHISPLS
jgi:hypothetical protein